MQDSAQPPLPSATRRVPMEIDKQGNPCFASVCSPESFKQEALCVLPPHNVIPVIFVPGIMGTNLKLENNPNVEAWSPPNGTLEGLRAAKKGALQSPIERQNLFDPNNTIVNPDGPCEVPGNLCWLTTSEAKRRSWGALHQDSYRKILQQLEICLNDQYSKPGHPQEKGNFLLPEIGMLSHLGGSSAQIPPGAPDYARIAAKAIQAWHTQPRALSQSEIGKLDHYYYPVWAHGYNWLHSNEDSAQSLLKKIDEIFAFYHKSDYFHCLDKVILVSHSMGGAGGSTGGTNRTQ